MPRYLRISVDIAKKVGAAVSEPQSGVENLLYFEQLQGAQM